MVGDVRGGILSALLILKDHWGAVGRDLAVAGYTWDEICSERLPLDQFVQFVVYSPPGTAVFHRVNDGWDANTHKITDLIEWIKMSLCAQGAPNGAAAQRAYDQLGADLRPGQVKAEEPPAMTIGEYMKLSGLED